jgi:hypothetical protein
VGNSCLGGSQKDQSIDDSATPVHAKRQ